MSDRSVHIRGNVSGSSIVTGDHNQVKVELPPPGQVDIGATVAAMRELLAQLGSEDQLIIDNAMGEAAHEAAKAEPRKEALGTALGRALDTASKTADLGEKLHKLAPLVQSACAWLGENWYPLLAHVGLTLAG